MRFHLPLLAAAALLSAAFLSTLAAAQPMPRVIKVPDDVLQRNPYVEAVPDADYFHASPEAYAAFKKLKYGIRIHWGLYSFIPNSSASWYFLKLNDQQRQEYVDYYKQWNPTDFNAEEWMQFFKRCGFTNFAITTKHHEGFALWDTKTRVKRRPNWGAPGGPVIEDCDIAYSVMDTPSKRDIIRELCDAARQHDIKINLYFSHSDWYDADFRPFGQNPMQTASAPEHKRLAERQGRPVWITPDPTPEERVRMMAKHREQLRELLTNYGKIDMMCFDIQFNAELWPVMKATMKEIRRIQPDVMFRNRGIGSYGDYHTPEREVPTSRPDGAMPWMVIYPLGNSTSYEENVAAYKGPKWVVTSLIESVSKGGNFMVGIGPDTKGRFHPQAMAQLEEVGAWLRINGEAIFDTHDRPDDLWREGESIRFTQADNGKFIYAHLLKRPDAPVLLKTVSVPATATIHLLGRDQPLNWKTTPEGLSIDFPADAAESHAYVLRLPIK